MNDKVENQVKHLVPLKKRPYVPKNDEIGEVHMRNATETTQSEVMNNKKGRKNTIDDNSIQIRVQKGLEEWVREEQRKKKDEERASEAAIQVLEDTSDRVEQREWYDQLKSNHDYSCSVKEKIKHFNLEGLKNQIGIDKCEKFLRQVDNLCEDILSKVNNALQIKEIRLKSVQEEFNAESSALMEEYEEKMEQLLSEVKSEVHKSKLKLEKTPKLKVPVQVEPPFIVYQLREEEINEDLSVINKAVAGK